MAYLVMASVQYGIAYIYIYLYIYIYCEFDEAAISYAILPETTMIIAILRGYRSETLDIIDQLLHQEHSKVGQPGDDGRDCRNRVTSWC